ncbi:NAC domain-containing protein [Tanacetum coccineum]|uniref:NAC domain-containing protein n=1 Tax=Tanacetum coccineum TaxID=301880 RepID=A0ABQ4ZYA6_9ASTR
MINLDSRKITTAKQNQRIVLTKTNEPKHANGNRPNRQTRNGGTWKAAQRCERVKDATNIVVGTRTCLTYLDEKKHKTPWLMHEYITTNPNIPAGSEKQNKDKKRLTNLVLCKIYKKQEPNRNANNNIWDQEAAIVEQNHLLEDEPSPRRRRVSMNQENNQWNGPQHIQIQESNHHSGTDVQMMAPVQFMLMSNQESDLNNVHMGFSQTLQSTSMDTSTNVITMQPMAMFCGSDSIQPSVEDHTQAFAMEQVQQSIGSSTCEYHQNQSWPSPTQGFKFSSDASSSSSMVLPHEEDATGHVTQLDYFITLPAQASMVQLDTNTDPMITMHQVDSLQNARDEVLQQHIQNSYHDIPSFSNKSTLMPDVEFDNLIKSMIAHESEDALIFYPPECYSYDDDLDKPMF